MAIAEMTPEGLRPRGRIGDTVFYKRNGKFYSRQYVKPRNPRTPAQVAQRERFKRAHQAWKQLSEFEKAKYRARARYPGLGYQLFMSENSKTTKEAA